jgi:CHAD domain-containing protein
MKMKLTDQEFGMEALRFRADVFTRHLTQLVSSISDKAVHETRVESRRMRVALDSFRDMFPPLPYNTGYKAVRQITHLLGEPRETSVIYGLMQSLADERGERGHACLGYLQGRLSSKLRKQKARLEKRLGRIDPLRIRSKIDFLISVMEPSEIKELPPCSSSSKAIRSHSMISSQPTFFPKRVTAAARFCRILDGFAASFAECGPTRQFEASTDADLHSLRVAAKKARYTIEIFSSIWPGGLGDYIEKARRFQEAAGNFNDWGTLISYLETEAKRLNSTESVDLVFEIVRLAEYAGVRKQDLRVAMRAALIEFLESLAGLRHTVRLLSYNPNWGPTDLIRSGIRARSRSRLKPAIGNS